ncbi:MULTISPECIES: hypothetical protein [Paenibacillus]|uniref:Uncharacterized protein n=1 Tax=Paenibacillus peoriae TaxID=59893 RepID=A0A7H0Y343_9BACL|nr:MULTISPECIES: hypothetical protein [Paenibacillus]QNR65501.1 hypothetical protein IAQ67_16575 [Paenibacillus peoriae]
MKYIRVIRKNGLTVLNKKGTNMDVLELSTSINTDRIVHEGEFVYIYCSA